MLLYICKNTFHKIFIKFQEDMKMKMKKRNIFLIITSILTLLLACVQIQAASLKAPTNIKVTATPKASVSIKWSKVSNVSGYEIWRASSAKGNYSKIKTIKNSSTTSYTNTKLKAGRYYYKVRAYKTSDIENVYSNFTKYAGVTVKVLDIMKYVEPRPGSYAAKFPSLIKKIGGMTKKYNSRYPAFYAAGNKMIIGANNNPKYSKSQNYQYIKNNGNYGVGIAGMQLGMTYSEADSILRNSGLRTFGNPTIYWWGNASRITLTIKNNTVTGFTYACAPTSD